MINTEKLPKWSKELIRFIPVQQQFLLYGNIYDFYPYYDKKIGYLSKSLKDYMNEILNEVGYEVVLIFEPLEGFLLLKGDEALLNKVGFKFENKKMKVLPLNNVFDLIKKLSAIKEFNSSVMINFSSRIKDLSMGNDLNDFLFNTFKLSLESTPVKVNDKMPLYNNCIFLFDKEEDVPYWYIQSNPKIRTIPIPKPDIEMRRWLSKSIMKVFEDYSDLNEPKKNEVIETLCEQTHSMYGREILNIVALAKKEELSSTQIAEAIRRYKVGVSDNPWAKIDRDKLLNAEDLLASQVIGQEKAINKSATILRRAFFNLSGSQYSKYSQRPKGALFFAGPTGVGKTELAKSITKLIFGNENSYIRFDMSEFAHEHSDQRLLGSPPGYVGYEVGGELVNSVKQNPFSVILFDEIEKAHPKILDIFLQILDDGRITSGKGDTVYLSETLIIFTSNLGIYEQLTDGTKVQRVSQDQPYEEIEKNVLSSIEDFFKYKIARPEILNRIGENIVVFDFIRKDSATNIADKMINSIIEKVKDEYKVEIELSPLAYEKVIEEIICDLSMGGRGVGNKIEEVFINPLSNLLFKLFPKENDTIIIKDINFKEERWELLV